MLTNVEVQYYDREKLQQIFTELFRQHGWLARLRERGTRVLLKPNFVMASAPGNTSTTHPDFYMALAQMLIAQGFTVGIGESPAFGSCTGALRAHGVLEQALAGGIEVVEFSKVQTYAGVVDERFYRELSVAAELDDWDSVINLPKLKTHRQFVFTGATKNLYGCVVGKRKFFRHNVCGNDPVRFARMVIANAMQVNCVLHIADGVESMHVNGPRGGAPYLLGQILASPDPLLLDWTFCKMVGLEPNTTPLFAALDTHRQEQLHRAWARHCQDLPVVSDFIHAPFMHISFSPWALARSCVRSIRHGLGLQVGV
jgi:uncharacterized protein (DUF362 family)